MEEDEAKLFFDKNIEDTQRDSGEISFNVIKVP